MYIPIIHTAIKMNVNGILRSLKTEEAVLEYYTRIFSEQRVLYRPIGRFPDKRFDLEHCYLVLNGRVIMRAMIFQFEDMTTARPMVSPSGKETDAPPGKYIVLSAPFELAPVECHSEQFRGLVISEPYF
jgi:hypothetical protein